MSLDIHLRNVLVRLPSTFEELSVEEFREKFGEPDMTPIARVDGKPLTPNVPAQAVVPLYLGKKAQEFSLDDARGLILSALARLSLQLRSGVWAGTAVFLWPSERPRLSSNRTNLCHIHQTYGVLELLSGKF